jgi:transcription initiation factor TFIID subunit 8
MSAIAREIMRVAAAQICQGVGFMRTQESASEMLVDVLLKYVEMVGLVARDSAEHAGRTEVNFVDVHAALQEFDTSVASLTEFAKEAEDTPCARAVPIFPVKRKRVLVTPDDERADDEPKSSETVPAWFPPFPHRSTYARTPTYAPHELDPQQARELMVKHRRDAETAIVGVLDAGARAASGDPSQSGALAPDAIGGLRAVQCGGPAPACRGTELLVANALPSARLPDDQRDYSRELDEAMRDQSDKRRKGGGAAGTDE